MAAEYYANFVDVAQPFKLETKILSGHDPNHSVNIGGHSAFLLLKPTEVVPPLTAKLAQALKNFSNTRDGADENAKKFVAAGGGDDALAKGMRATFGEFAGKFFKELLQEPHLLKGPMVVDLRNANPSNGGCEQVWNHALFYMKAKYQETATTYDEFDLTIVCKLVANDDTPQDDGMPGSINPKTGVINLDGTQFPHRKAHYKWHLFFGGSGDLLPSESRNEWLYARADGNVQGAEIYAPGHLEIPLLPQKDRFINGENDAPPRMRVGNKFIGHELVTSGLLQLNSKRFPLPK